MELSNHIPHVNVSAKKNIDVIETMEFLSMVQDTCELVFRDGIPRLGRIKRLAFAADIPYVWPVLTEGQYNWMYLGSLYLSFKVRRLVDIQPVPDSQKLTCLELTKKIIKEGKHYDYNS